MAGHGYWAVPGGLHLFVDNDGCIWHFEDLPPVGFDQALAFQRKSKSPHVGREVVDGDVILVCQPPVEFVSDVWLEDQVNPLIQVYLDRTNRGLPPAPFTPGWDPYRAEKARLRAEFLPAALEADKPGPWRCPFWGCVTFERDWGVVYPGITKGYRVADFHQVGGP